MAAEKKPVASGTAQPRQCNMVIPKVTVLLPVYNGERYIAAAIESILVQTFRDFQLLVIDDGSEDGTFDVCAGYDDPRITLVRNEKNLGLIATLNKGLNLCRGDYIARLDCDDFSFPNRLARQVEFMERNPEVGVCGTWFERIAAKGKDVVKPPVDDGVLRFLLLFHTNFCHSTIFLRRSVLESNGLLYDPDYKYAEDYDFWVRCAEYTKLAHIPEVLLSYSYHPENISNRFRVEQGLTADRIRRRQLDRLGLAASEAEIEMHHALARFEFSSDIEGLARARDWLDKLVATGCRRIGISPDEPRRDLARYWYAACGKSADRGLPIWRLFRSSPVGRAAPWEWQWKLFVRCLLRRNIAWASADGAA
jgi:GT2 family glycosyltransferase